MFLDFCVLCDKRIELPPSDSRRRVPPSGPQVPTENGNFIVNVLWLNCAALEQEIIAVDVSARQNPWISCKKYRYVQYYLARLDHSISLRCTGTIRNKYYCATCRTLLLLISERQEAA